MRRSITGAKQASPPDEQNVTRVPADLRFRLLKVLPKTTVQEICNRHKKSR